MLHPRFGFFSRGEKEVLNMVVANLDTALDASRHLLALVSALKAHDHKAVVRESNMISELESRADDAHLKSVEHIVAGSFFGGIREDLLGLLEQIDNMTDAAKDSARVFVQRRIADPTIDYFFREDVLSFVTTCVETAELLKTAVMSLAKSKSEVMKLSAEIEKSEEKADAIRGTILENLLKNEVGADPLDIMMLKEFLDIADDVADCAEDGSDVLLILVAKGYT